MNDTIRNQIEALDSMRLPDLQTAILDDDVPSFERLMSYDSEAFYLADPGTNYAQARYLCLYLQEQGLLHFTASVRRHHRAGHGGAHPHRHCVKTP